MLNRRNLPQPGRKVPQQSSTISTRRRRLERTSDFPTPHKDDIIIAVAASLETGALSLPANFGRRTRATHLRPVSRRSEAIIKKPRKEKSKPKKVHFAQGPLRAPSGGPDGHPTAEGRVAKPVRVLERGATRGAIITKKDVRELEQPELLGNAQYEHSITKLKIRVGLLPARAPSRPFVSKPGRRCPITNSEQLVVEAERGCRGSNIHAAEKRSTRARGPK